MVFKIIYLFIVISKEHNNEHYGTMVVASVMEDTTQHTSTQHTIYFSQTNTGNIFGRQKSESLFMSSLVKEFPRTLTHIYAWMRRCECKTVCKVNVFSQESGE